MPETLLLPGQYYFGGESPRGRYMTTIDEITDNFLLAWDRLGNDRYRVCDWSLGTYGLGGPFGARMAPQRRSNKVQGLRQVKVWLVDHNQAPNGRLSGPPAAGPFRLGDSERLTNRAAV